MDSKALAEYLDQTRWLLNNGLINDGVKNQLLFYGSIVHKDVQAVELTVDVATKLIDYRVYINKDLMEKVKLFNRLRDSSKIFDMWRFKRLLKKEGSLNFQHLLNQFVKDYCGPKWSATATVLDIVNYVEGYEKDGEQPAGMLSDK